MKNDLDAAQRASQEQFGKQSAKYGKGHILENTEDVAQALNDLSLKPGQKALDVATGGGHTAVYLAKIGLEVTASDLTPAMLERTGELAREKGFSLELKQHSAEQLPYPDGSFDLVTCRVAAHHFSNPQQFVRESARVLKPGGYFLVIDGSVPDDHPEAEEWIHQIEKFRDPSHGRFITPRTWTRWAGESGLRTVKVELQPFKQPDLEWYFETANTSPENRAKVKQLIENAPASAREVFKLGTEEGRIVWWWPRLVFVAQKDSGVRP